MNISLCWSVSFLLVTTLEAGPFAGPLTVGSPAPPLKLAGFVKGEPVGQLVNGNVYAIEFSGIQCAPCIRSMPLLTEFQKKHPHVTLISVYSEKPEDVRAHLAGHDAEIGYRVALDDKGTMSKTWQQASEVRGIPMVFLVAKDGTIAWIGMPDRLDAALADLAAGSIDPRLERTRLAFGQADSRAFDEWEKRKSRSREAQSRPYALAEERKWAEAIEVAEQGAHDFPDDAFQFHSAKLYVLASNPQTAERAVAFAAELSATMSLDDLGKGQSGMFNAKIAQALLDGGRENGDSIFTEAAAILIGRAEAGLGRIKDEDKRFVTTKYVSQIAASLDARKKDYKAAAERLRRTLALIRSRPCPETSAEARIAWEKDRRDQIEEVEVGLLEYVKAEAGRPKP